MLVPHDHGLDSPVSETAARLRRSATRQRWSRIAALSDPVTRAPVIRTPVIRAPVTWAAVFSVALAALVFATPALAHEVRPAYWQIEETETDVLDSLWKQPVFADQEPGMARRLPVDPLFPNTCEVLRDEPARRATGALLKRTVVRCPGGLRDAELQIAGLERTLMDVLVRVSWLDGSRRSVLVKPTAPRFDLQEEGGASVPTYLILGVEHMLFGYDHLLFVLGLTLLSRRLWEVAKLITAFTVAHSITLALTALGLLALPQGPVEAIIALSILFLAVEILQPEERRSVLARRSWIVAFGFGLLHGCGFAGALAEIGLPEDAAVPALFLFNVGVEVGQLATVAALLAVFWVVERLLQRRAAYGTAPPSPASDRRSIAFHWADALAAVMGVVSATWFVERTLGLFG